MAVTAVQTFERDNSPRDGTRRRVVTKITNVNTKTTSGIILDPDGATESIVIGLRLLENIKITVTKGYSVSFSSYSDGRVVLICYQSKGSSGAHAPLSNEDGDLAIAIRVEAEGY